MTRTLSQTELVKDVAEKLNILRNFGIFSVSERTSRTGRNPRTGETISIPATKVLKFKVSKSLKDAINQ